MFLETWMNLAHLLDRMARQDPARPAIFEGSRCVATHGQWAERAARVGAHLQAVGLQPGERAAIWAPNVWEWIVALLGLHAAGRPRAFQDTMARFGADDAGSNDGSPVSPTTS